VTLQFLQVDRLVSVLTVIHKTLKEVVRRGWLITKWISTGVSSNVFGSHWGGI